ncbi:hypothetical protein [Treponema sp.]|uniref:hypothetical protein n=1 Tax=Treponema sp. TaxID=166 RepID=UPI003F0C4382
MKITTPLKKVLMAVLFFMPLASSFARGKNELVQSGHWIYDALTAVALEQGRLDFTDRSPLSVGEILFFLDEADYSCLSSAGKIQYDRIKKYCAQESFCFGPDIIRLGFEMELNTEAYYKQNDDLDWNYDRYSKGDFLYVPVKIEGADYFTMFFDAKLALNKNTKEDDDNFLSIPISADEIDINFPDTAYFSTSHNLGDTAAFTFQAGRGASDFTRSLTGSIVQSRYFTGSSYMELGFYTRNFRYSMNVDQFNVDKYLYSHELNFRFFKKLQFTARESLLVYAPMELRYLNPWTVYHGFAAWRDYGHNESNTCDYLALKLAYTPVKYLRLYGEFAMTQYQTPYETSNFEDDTTPNGISFQGGVESFIPFNEGYFHLWLEGTYADTYMYIKESPDWSMVRNYRENLGDTKYVFYEWLGTPFGPDTVSGKLSIEYEKPAKWSLGASYLLKVCGLNSGRKVFENIDWHEGDEYVIDESEAGKENRKDWTFPDSDSQGREEADKRQNRSAPSGTNEYVNVVSIRGTFSPAENITFVLQPSYSFVINYANESGRNETGFEVAFAANIKIL